MGDKHKTENERIAKVQTLNILLVTYYKCDRPYELNVAATMFKEDYHDRANHIFHEAKRDGSKSYKPDELVNFAIEGVKEYFSEELRKHKGNIRFTYDNIMQTVVRTMHKRNNDLRFMQNPSS